MLGVNVTYIMKPGKRMEFLEAVNASGVQTEIRQENGCIQYDFFLPLDHEDEMLLMEKWTGKEAQQIHLTQPHMAKLRGAKEQFVLDTKVEFYEL